MATDGRYSYVEMGDCPVVSGPVARPPSYLTSTTTPSSRPIFSGQAVFILTDLLCNYRDGLRGADLFRHSPSKLEWDPRDATLFILPQIDTATQRTHQLNQSSGRLVPPTPNSVPFLFVFSQRGFDDLTLPNQRAKLLASADARHQ